MFLKSLIEEKNIIIFEKINLCNDSEYLIMTLLYLK